MKKIVFGCCLVFTLFGLAASSVSQHYQMKIVGKHSDEVLGVFVNKTDSRFATCSLDETIKIWSLPSGKEERTLTGHLGQVNNISFSGDDKLLASASSDRTVRVWDVESGEMKETLRGHTREVIGVYFSQDSLSSFIASTSFDKTVKLWDTKYLCPENKNCQAGEVKTLRGHDASTNNVGYSYDGKYLASCSDDGAILIWSVPTLLQSGAKESSKPEMKLDGHTAPVLTVLFSFDSKLLASSDKDGNVRVWEMPDGRQIAGFKAHDELCQDVSFAEDNQTLVTGSLDKKIKLWNAKTGELKTTIDVGVEVWSIDITSNAKTIIAGCADGSVRMFTEGVAAPSTKSSDSKPESKKKGTKK